MEARLEHPDGWKAPALGRCLNAMYRAREMSVLLALLLVSGSIAVATPYFLTVDNLMGVFRSFSTTAMMSIGMVMVIVTGGIDLSVGSVMGLAGLVTALAFDHGFSTVFSVSCGLGVGVAFGFVNGLLVTVGRLPPFIATLGTLSIGRGLMYIVTKGVPVTPATPEIFNALGQGYIGSVPAPVVIMLVLALAFSVLIPHARILPARRGVPGRSDGQLRDVEDRQRSDGQGLSRAHRAPTSTACVLAT